MKDRNRHSNAKQDSGRARASSVAAPAPDLRAFLDAWRYDAGDNVRFDRAANGREIMVVRQRMGLEQYEVSGRPDGLRPHGEESALHFQLARLASARAAEAEEALKLSPAECAELFEEAALYDQRLRHFLRLRDWERAAGDSARNLRLLDFVSRHAEHAEDRAELEPWRPGTVRMNAIARAIPLFDHAHYDEALAIARAGLGSLDGADEHPALRETLLRRLRECLAAGPEDRRRQESHFIQQGDFWTVSYQGKTSHFKATRGLRLLADLLRHPGREFHVSELLGHPVEAPAGALMRLASADGIGPAHHAGSGEPLLDARAKTEIQQRLEELRGDLEEAVRCNDTGRAAEAREEMEGIAEQLASAFGLGGRDREARSPVERARSAVTKRIKESIARIAEVLPQLGRHLTARIKTGHFCSYNPHPDRWVVWKF